MPKKSSRYQRNNRRRRAIRKPRRRGFNPIRGQLTPWISALGRGKQTKLVTSLYTENLSGNVAIELSSFRTTREFKQLQEDWELLKLLKIVITFYPNNLNSSVDPIYLRINWDGSVKQYLPIEDNVKIIPAYRIGFKSFVVRIPKIEVSGGENIGTWFPFDEFSLVPSKIQLYSPSEQTVQFRVDVLMKAKVPVIRQLTKTKEEAEKDGTLKLLQPNKWEGADITTSGINKTSVEVENP